MRLFSRKKPEKSNNSKWSELFLARIVLDVYKTVTYKNDPEILEVVEKWERKVMEEQDEIRGKN